MVKPRQVDHKSTTQQLNHALDQWRHSFWTGRRVPLHRALRKLTPQQSDLLSIVLIPLLASALLLYFQQDISLFFMGAMYFFLDPLIDPLRFAAHSVEGMATPLFVPRIAGNHPRDIQWWWGYATCAALLIASAMPIRRAVAFRHFAVFFGTIQLASQLYFSIGNGLHAVHSEDYLVDAMELSLYWIGLTPWLLGITFNLFPFSTLHKLRLTALAVCYQLLLFPVQYACQAWVLHIGSGLWAPLLFFTTGVPFNVLTTMAFYGIGLSWPQAEREEA